MTFAKMEPVTVARKQKRIPRRAGRSGRVVALDLPRLQVEGGVSGRQKEGEGGDPGHRNVEEDDPGGLSDEVLRGVCVEKGAPEDDGHADSQDDLPDGFRIPSSRPMISETGFNPDQMCLYHIQVDRAMDSGRSGAELFAPDSVRRGGTRRSP